MIWRARLEGSVPGEPASNGLPDPRETHIAMLHGEARNGQRRSFQASGAAHTR
jgi:hypothetical protein